MFGGAKDCPGLLELSGIPSQVAPMTADGSQLPFGALCIHDRFAPHFSRSDTMVSVPKAAIELSAYNEHFGSRWYFRH
jgi:hypothetical protein